MTDIPVGYKQTEVGIIPNDWEVSELSKKSKSIQSGKNNFKKSYGKYPVYGSTGIIGYTDSFKYNGNYLLVARVGANAGALNMVDGKYDVSDNTLIIIPSNINIKFLHYYLSKFNIGNLAFGSGQPLVTSTQLKAIALPIPPTIEEQQAIATTLSDMDELISSLDELIEKKKNIKKGAMQKLLSPKEGWIETTLGGIAEIYQPTTISGSMFKNNGYPVYGANGVIGYYDKYNHETAQVLVTCRGSSCGTINLSKGKCRITGNAMVINVDRYKNISKNFLYFLLTYKDLTSLITGSGQPQIVKGPLSNYTITIPPTTEEQQEIATILSDMDKEIEALEEKKAKYEQIKQGAMQKLLTGKIRLV